MIELGKRQVLMIAKKVEFGVYLADGRVADSPEERVLLPGKEVPDSAQIGDELDVFIYRDSKDRLIATTRQTSITVGHTALLKVKEVGKIGAFLAWELEKDLLLPFKEQTAPVKEQEECLVALYVDKSGRLCTTMKVYHYLETDSPYKKDDIVQGIVYEISKRFGVFVAVDDRYSGLIPAKEPSNVKVGERVQARVAGVLEDGKLTLSLREKAHIQIGKDAEIILEMLERAGGRLPLHDKADPELIKEKTGMSKNEFKRAIGSLYRQRLIIIEPDGIQKV
ncbi:MAG: S1 RNA-binding domain-containing protein [Lachnospiraceae bacterium]|nr:S1 RNA-binding domain-containing protein [Lachnospiraceae bacterium]